MSNYAKGYDVSSIQRDIPFQKIADNGAEFVILRCYIGNDGIDPNYKTYVTQAKAAGLKVMCYNFIFPLPDDGQHPNRDPISQANLHFNASGGELAAVDAEFPIVQEWKKWGCSASQLNDWILKYLEEYTRLSGGLKPVVYTYPNYAQSIKFSSEMAQYPLWIASYTSTPVVPAPWTDWVIWQNSGGSLERLPNGIAVDTDFCKDMSIFDRTMGGATTDVADTTSSGENISNLAISGIWNTFETNFSS